MMNPSPQRPAPDSPPVFAGSWRLGSVFGIELRVHAGSLFLLAIILLLFSDGKGDAGLGWPSLLLIVALVYLSVIAHELGHALSARRYGIRTHAILLTPLAGVTLIEGRERLERRPWAAFFVAAAGPAVNLALAGLAFPLVLALPEEGTPRFILSAALAINVVMGVVNLAPVFPMDGGRILSALLSLRYGPDRATVIAGAIGRWLTLPAMAACVAMFLVTREFFWLWLVLMGGFFLIVGHREMHGARARIVHRYRAMQRWVSLARQARLEIDRHKLGDHAVAIVDRLGRQRWIYPLEPSRPGDRPS